MPENKATLSISIPTKDADQFRQHWKEMRLSDALSPELDLKDPIESENFDGTTLVQWVVQISEAVVPLITASLGYLVASRGELEYEKDGEKIRIKNLKPSRIREIIEIIDARKQGG